MVLITISATKESKDSKVGVVYRTIEEDGISKVIIKKISDTSIFQGTALQPGYELVKLNDKSVKGMSLQDLLELTKEAESEVKFLVLERYGQTATATVVKTSDDMKTGMILRNVQGVPGVYVKEFTDASPFKGKLPTGTDYRMAFVNEVPVEGMSPSEVASILAGVPKDGSLMVTMKKIPAVVASTGPKPPPGVDAGGQWGSVKYHGPGTTIAAIVGFFFLGAGLLVVCCPCDEMEVYHVNGKLYERDGSLAGHSPKLFTASHPAPQKMAR